MIQRHAQIISNVKEGRYTSRPLLAEQEPGRTIRLITNCNSFCTEDIFYLLENTESIDLQCWTKGVVTTVQKFDRSTSFLHYFVTNTMMNRYVLFTLNKLKHLRQVLVLDCWKKKIIMDEAVVAAKHYVSGNKFALSSNEILVSDEEVGISSIEERAKKTAILLYEIVEGTVRKVETFSVSVPRSNFDLCCDGQCYVIYNERGVIVHDLKTKQVLRVISEFRENAVPCSFYKNSFNDKIAAVEVISDLRDDSDEDASEVSLVLVWVFPNFE